MSKESKAAQAAEIESLSERIYRLETDLACLEQKAEDKKRLRYFRKWAKRLDKLVANETEGQHASPFNTSVATLAGPLAAILRQEASK